MEVLSSKGVEPNVDSIDEAPELPSSTYPMLCKQEIPQRPGGAGQHPPFAVSLLDIEGKQLVRPAGVSLHGEQAGVLLADEVTQDGFGQFQRPPGETSNVHVSGKRTLTARSSRARSR